METLEKRVAALELEVQELSDRLAKTEKALFYLIAQKLWGVDWQNSSWFINRETCQPFEGCEEFHKFANHYVANCDTLQED